MNRNVLIALIAIIVIGGGYYQFSYKPAQEAAAMAQKAADDAAAAAKAAEEKAAADAAAAAEKAAADAATAAADTLDPAKFDAAKVNALIAASSLDDATKATLKAGVDAAATNPAGVAAAVAAVKAALGM